MLKLYRSLFKTWRQCNSFIKKSNTLKRPCRQIFRGGFANSILLYYSQLNVKEIAYNLDYEDHSYFTLFPKGGWHTGIDFS